MKISKLFNLKSLRSSLLLLLGAVIWGFAFAFQRAGMDSMEPISFNGIRNLMAGVCLSAVVWIADRINPDRRSLSENRKRLQKKAGLLCGFFLFLASSLQQAGLVETTAGKAGFITALYVVLVPVAGWLLFHQSPGKWIALSVLLAVAGLFLLCVPTGEHLSLSRGDLLVLGCAVCFTGQILAVDRFSPGADGIRMSRDMFLVCGSLGVLCSIFIEKITWNGFYHALPALLYAGILSGAVGYTLQILGQRNLNPTVASLLMSLESVFSVLSGAILLGEHMSARESSGCVIMFSAVVLAQLSPLLKHGQRNRRVSIESE